MVIIFLIVIIERMYPATFYNVLLKVNLAFNWRKEGWLHREKYWRKVATHQSSNRCLLIECPLVNSHPSGEVQLKHKISLMPSRNYNKKHFRSGFTKRSEIIFCEK